ncbi:MAG: hypothetical protein IKG18_00100 [Atopobiaceae bacterium]|nr:hypothetical protein [Atopobiaceae bacterium]MBR3312516.1 hypothetical protein [Atopobiaceae bacterium]
MLVDPADYDDDVYVWLESVLLARESVPEADAKALVAQAGELGAEEGVWFDLSLNMRVGEQGEVRKLHKTPKPVKLSVAVPESIRAGEGVSRTFYQLRYHDDAAEHVATTEGDTLEWESDRFSTHLIAYKDAQTPATATPAAATPATGTTSTTTTTPTKTTTTQTQGRTTLASTADPSVNTGAIALLGLLAFLGGVRRKKAAH